MILLIEREGQEVVVNVRRIEEKQTALGSRTVINAFIYNAETGEDMPVGDIDLNRERVRLLPNG